MVSVRQTVEKQLSKLNSHYCKFYIPSVINSFSAFAIIHFIINHSFLWNYCINFFKNKHNNHLRVFLGGRGIKIIFIEIAVNLLIDLFNYCPVPEMQKTWLQNFQKSINILLIINVHITQIYIK